MNKMFTAGQDLSAGVETGGSRDGAGQLVAALAARAVTQLAQRTWGAAAVVANLKFL